MCPLNTHLKVIYPLESLDWNQLKNDSFPTGRQEIQILGKYRPIKNPSASRLSESISGQRDEEERKG